MTKEIKDLIDRNDQEQKFRRRVKRSIRWKKFKKRLNRNIYR
jgi:hypothetical protein